MKKFNKLLTIHCHTSGLDYDSDDITNNNQALSVALGVVDLKTLKLIDVKTLRVKFDHELYTWNSKLESIHGISKEESFEGENLQDAASIIGEFLYEHFGLKDSIPTIGYNVLGFHIPFVSKILKSEGLHFEFDNRSLDLFTLMALMNCYTIKEVYELFGIDSGEVLSSLESIKMYLKIFKTFKSLLA